MKDDNLNVALWATNLSRPVSSMQGWADLVEKHIQQAKEKKASVLLMPEYAAEQWMHFAKEPLTPTTQIAWMAAQVDQALPLLQKLSHKHDILLAAGTFPCASRTSEPPFVNRAHVFFPNGDILMQDKLCLTPKEKNPQGWNLSTGDRVTLFTWHGWKIALLVCLDIELPALSAKLSGEGIDLVLVPSMTKKLAGYHRVFDCAKARAIELQAAIGVCGVIGGGPNREKNISGASFFLPCEEQFGHTGILAHMPPGYETPDAGPLLISELPLGRIRALRQSGAEVWPGAFDACPVTIGQKP